MRRDPKASDVAHSCKPDSWDALFELYGRDDAADGYMGPADRRQPPQDREPFDGWEE